jgi:hypothetical protein
MNATNLCLVRIPICMEGFNVVYIFDGVIYDAELGRCLLEVHRRRLTGRHDERPFAPRHDPSSLQRKKKPVTVRFTKYQWRAPKIFLNFLFFFLFVDNPTRRIFNLAEFPSFDSSWCLFSFLSCSPWVSHLG